MIVNYTSSGWSIITQRSHGLLAAQICAHWKKDNQPERWVETLIATAAHDDANNEFDKDDLLEENGGPTNFKMVPFEKGYCDNLLKMAFGKGRYIGLLISHHIQFLYRKDPTAKSYCSDLRKKEKSWLSEAKATAAEIRKSYQLLEFCDAFSLLICQQLIQPENRKMEISNGPDGKSYELYVGTNQQLIVDPWPFEEILFAVNYESRTIPQLSFKSTKEFKHIFSSTSVELHQIYLSKG